MKLQDLPNWPPATVGPNPAQRNTLPRPDQVTLRSVGPRRQGNGVAFTGEFKGNPHTYAYDARHAKLADHLETVLRAHIGKSVLHLGDIEIDEDALIE